MQISFPPGVTETKVLRECEAKGAAEGAAFVVPEECLLPYATHVFWVKDGVRVADQPFWSRDGNPLPTLQMASPTKTVFVLPSAYTVHDDVDCTPLCNKGLDGYLKFRYWDGNGAVITTARSNCQTQDAATGTCLATQLALYNVRVETITGTGSTACSGHKFYIQLWDDDVTTNNMMDISIALSQDEAEIQARDVLTSVSLPLPPAGCVLTTERWWGDRGNTQTADTTRHCHYTTTHTSHDGETSSCALTGQYDTTGDHDDVSLMFDVPGIGIPGVG